MTCIQMTVRLSLKPGADKLQRFVAAYFQQNKEFFEKNKGAREQVVREALYYYLVERGEINACDSLHSSPLPAGSHRTPETRRTPRNVVDAKREDEAPPEAAPPRVQEVEPVQVTPTPEPKKPLHETQIKPVGRSSSPVKSDAGKTNDGGGIVRKRFAVGNKF